MNTTKPVLPSFGVHDKKIKNPRERLFFLGLVITYVHS